MINLFVPYYVDKVASRRVELKTCLLKNLLGGHVRVHLIIDDPNTLEELKQEVIDHKIPVLFIHYRPTYNAVFDLINSVTGDNDWNVLINSDIYVDETIKLLEKYNSNDFIALARWDVDNGGNAKHYNTWDSQDTWCFKGTARKMDADFFQGVAGCDNAIAERAHRARYNVLNPSKTIKTYHLHNSGIRNYNPSAKVPQPYKMITPHE